MRYSTGSWLSSFFTPFLYPFSRYHAEPSSLKLATCQVSFACKKNCRTFEVGCNHFASWTTWVFEPNGEDNPLNQQKKMPKGRPLCLQVIKSFVVLLDLLRLPPLLQVHTCYELYDTDTLLMHLAFQGLGNPRWSHFIDNQFNQFQFPQLVGISYMPIERFQFTIFSNSI